MQSKVALATLLKDYKFTVNPKTKEPLEISPTFLGFTSKQPIWLDIEKI